MSCHVLIVLVRCMPNFKCNQNTIIAITNTTNTTILLLARLPTPHMLFRVKISTFYFQNLYVHFLQFYTITTQSYHSYHRFASCTLTNSLNILHNTIYFISLSLGNLRCNQHKHSLNHFSTEVKPQKCWKLVEIRESENTAILSVLLTSPQIIHRHRLDRKKLAFVA